MRGTRRTDVIVLVTLAGVAVGALLVLINGRAPEGLTSLLPLAAPTPAPLATNERLLGSVVVGPQRLGFTVMNSGPQPIGHLRLHWACSATMAVPPSRIVVVRAPPGVPARAVLGNGTATVRCGTTWTVATGVKRGEWVSLEITLLPPTNLRTGVRGWLSFFDGDRQLLTQHATPAIVQYRVGAGEIRF